jgi:drug/metabolite transporter (DMT)-like permease
MKGTNIKWTAILAVVAASVLWGLDGLLRTELYSLPPLTIIFAEHAIGTVIAVPFLIAFRKKLQKLTRLQLVAVVAVALISGVIGTVLFTAALQQIEFIPFSVVILLQQLEPIFAIVSAAILLKEKISPRFMALTAVALLSGYMLSFPDLRVNFGEGSAGAIAALMAVGAAAAWGIGTSLSKYALKDTFWLQITGIRFAFATLISGAALLVIPGVNAVSTIDSSQTKTLVLIALSTGFVAMALYYYGLQKIRASRATILELAFPLTSVIVGWIVFKDALTITQWIGAILLTTTAYFIARQEVIEKQK